MTTVLAAESPARPSSEMPESGRPCSTILWSAKQTVTSAGVGWLVVGAGVSVRAA